MPDIQRSAKSVVLAVALDDGGRIVNAYLPVIRANAVETSVKAPARIIAIKTFLVSASIGSIGGCDLRLTSN
jgi:hypothetical protein